MNKIQAKAISLALGLGVALMVPAIAAAASGGVSTTTTPVYTNGGCSVTIPGVNSAKNNAFTYDSSTQEAAVPLTITGSGCTADVSVASWNAPAGTSSLQDYKDQQFYTGRTLSLGPGSYNYHVGVRPQCSFQTDVMIGDGQKDPNGQANYGANLMGYTQFPGAACPNFSPAPTPTPTPTPTPAPTPTPTPTQTQSTPVSVCSGNTTNTSSDIASQGGNCSTNTTIVQTPSTAPQTASEQCSLLTSTNPSSMTATAAVNFQTQSGVNLQDITYNFGDGTSVPSTSQTSLSHTYQQAGTYTVTATLDFSGGSQTVQPATCQATVNITATPAQTTSTSAPTVTPAAPTVTTTAATQPASLVNTGPGNLAALFGLTVIISALSYRYFLRRHLDL